MRKILVVGLGNMGTTYIRNLLGQINIHPADIVGMDIDPLKIIAAMANFPGVSFTDNFNNMLSPNRIDTAIVATNTPSHHRVIIDLINRGARYFLCEKPLAISLSSADKIGEAAQKTGAKIYTAFLMNFSPVISALESRMRSEDLIFASGNVIWGKNRMGDKRPTPGDLEDELVHGAGILHCLASVNQRIKTHQVSGALGYLKFVDLDAQQKACRLDASFPQVPNSNSMVLEQIQTDCGVVLCSLYSSFLHRCQVRQVYCLLSKREHPEVPVYSVEMNFDIKTEEGWKDRLDATKLDGNKTEEVLLLPTNKILEQTKSFIAAASGAFPDVRLTDFDKARKSVAFSEAVAKSHLNNGAPILL